MKWINVAIKMYQGQTSKHPVLKLLNDMQNSTAKFLKQATTFTL